MGDLHVVACPHPMRVEQRRYVLPEGLTVAEILAAVQPDPELLRHAHVFVGDQAVPWDMRGQVKPKAGQQITVRVVPGGGRGKNPLATILSIAVIAAAAWAGPAAANALAFNGASGGIVEAVGLSSVTSSLISVAVGVTGQLAIAAAFAPKQTLSGLSGSAESPTYSLSGGRNRLAPYAPVPRVLGRHLIVPPYAAPPYTELIGQDQYMRFLFLLGYGPVEIELPRIGESSLYDYEDVETEFRQGFADDPPITLYPGQVVEEGVGVTLTEAGSWTQRTTGPLADEIAAEFLFPQGLLRFDDAGEKQVASVQVEVQYREVGQVDWIELAPYVEWANPRNLLLPPPPTPLVFGEGSGDPPVVSRYVVVTILARTGELQAINGEIGGGFDLHGDSRPAPTVPVIPAGHLPVCQVLISSDGSISGPVDIRSALLTATDPGHFAPSLDGLTVVVQPGRYESNALTIAANKAAALRYGVGVRVPQGQYEIRARRVTPDSTSDRVFDVVQWSLLRTIRNGSPIALDGMAAVALRIKATDQLQGVIDQFSCVCTSIIPDWDGSAWVERATGNPASIARALLQSSGVKKAAADSSIDLAAFADLAEACRANNWTFGAVVEQSTTTDRLLSDVLSSARASRGMKDGKHTVIRDQLQTTPWALLTPRNSWGVRGEKVFLAVPHALRVRFVDEESGWRQQETYVYDDGYSEANATEIQDLDLYGVTNADMAWKQGRYYLACLRLRPETHSRLVDVEHLTFTRGDLIRVVDDVALHGISSGRVKSVVLDELGRATAIVIDERIAMEAGKTYAVRIRHIDGTLQYAAVATQAGEQTTLTFSVPLTTVPEVDDLVAFGESERETSEKIVTRIEMQNDLAARVYYVDAAPAVHTADSGTIPPWDPQITVPADVTRIPPATPEFLDVVSDDRALVRRSDGTVISRMLVSVNPGTGGQRTARLELQFRPVSGGPWISAPDIGEGREVAVESVEDGTEYRLRLRAINAYGYPSAWVERTHTVLGKLAPPPQPDVFLVRAQPDGTREFDIRLAVKPLDFAGYRIRYRLGTGWAWDDMQPLHQGDISVSPYESNQLAAGEYTFACRTVDTSGLLSTGIKYIEQTLPDPRLAGVLETYSEFGDGWPGTKTDCFVTEQGFLSASDSTTWGDLTTWAAWTRWNLAPISPIVYERQLDLGTVASFIPLVTLDADGTLTIEEQHSSDNVTYSSWATAGSLITARYVRIRVTLAGSYPLIREMTTLLSATPKAEDFEDMDTSTLAGAYRIGVGDIRLPLTESFATIKQVAVTLQNVDAGWTSTLVDKNTATGPRIKIYNGSGVLADATIDATVRGI